MSKFRKTPEQQIASAKEALQKAVARQRRHDAHSKIVMGAITHTWMLSDPRAAKAFLTHLEGIQVRTADAGVINTLRVELSNVVKKAQGPVFNPHSIPTVQSTSVEVRS